MTTFIVTYGFLAAIYAAMFLSKAKKMKVKMTTIVWLLFAGATILWPVAVGYGVYLQLKEK